MGSQTQRRPSLIINVVSVIADNRAQMHRQHEIGAGPNKSTYYCPGAVTYCVSSFNGYRKLADCRSSVGILSAMRSGRAVGLCNLPERTSSCVKYEMRWWSEPLILTVIVCRTDVSQHTGYEYASGEPF